MHNPLGRVRGARTARGPIHVCVLLAFFTTSLAFAWQSLTVHYNYGGNWTALFCTGSKSHPPPDVLAFEHIYRFTNSYGYDGQFYHYMAHDPFLTRGFAVAIDSPRFRYRRILVSVAAWCLAGGQDRFVDNALFAVVLTCLFLAVLWSSRLASDVSVHPSWGAAVVFVPAVVISLDRMTVDIALVAFSAGIVFYLQSQQWAFVFWLCALAGLVRESALLLPAGIFVWAALQRRFRIAALMALATIPTFAWYAWIALRTPLFTGDLLSAVPFAGLVQRILTPFPYRFSAAVNLLATVLDYFALAGIVVAILYCALHVRDLWRRPEGFMAFSFVALVAVVSTPSVWVEAYAFTRGYSPLILLVGLDGLRTRSLFGFLPLALTAPRIGLQLGSQVLNVVQAFSAPG